MPEGPSSLPDDFICPENGNQGRKAAIVSRWGIKFSGFVLQTKSLKISEQSEVLLRNISKYDI